MDSSTPSDSKPINGALKSVSFASTLTSTATNPPPSSSSVLTTALPSSSILRSSSTTTLHGGGMILQLSSSSTGTKIRIPKRKKAQWFRPSRDALDDDEDEEDHNQESAYIEEITITKNKNKKSTKRKRGKLRDDGGDDEGSDNDDQDNADDDGNEEEEAGSGVPLQRLGNKNDRNEDDDDEEDDHEPPKGKEDDEESRPRSSGTKIKALKRVRGERWYDTSDQRLNDGKDDDNDNNIVPIVPFHLQSEREEGYYNDEGEYVWKKKENDEEEDAWLAAMDEEKGKEGTTGFKDDTKGNRKSKQGWNNDDDDSSSDNEEEEEEEEHSTDNPQTTKEKEALQRARALYTLAHLLQDSESVVQALRRLGKPLSSSSSSTTKNNSSSSGSNGNRNQFNRLTEAVDLLVSTGMTDAYTLTRTQAKFELNDILDEMDIDEDEFFREQQQLQQKETNTKEEKDTSETAIPRNASDKTVNEGSVGTNSSVSYLLPVDQTWEYRWTDPSTASASITNGSTPTAGSDTYGPFTSEQMNQWIGVGYFASVVPYVRMANGEERKDTTNGWIRLDQYFYGRTM